MGGPVGEAAARASNANRKAVGTEAIEVPEPQVVQVVLPDGDVEVRFVSVDVEAGQLKLRQVGFDEQGEVSFGGEAAITLTSIGDAAIGGAGGKAVHLHAGGSAGPVLLELHFDGADVALLWKESLQALRSSSGASADRDGAEAGAEAEAQASATLKALVDQQEEQVRLLEEINDRKVQQLLKMQERLEAALEMLHAGQNAYAQQQQIVDQQTPLLAQLQAKLEVVDKIQRECSDNAAAASAGALAAARAGASGPLARAAMQAAAAAQTAPADAAAGQIRRQPAGASSTRPAAGGSASTDASTSAEVEDVDAEDEDEDEEDAGEAAAGQADPAANAAIVSKLQALMAEKGEVEAQLRSEQAEIEAHMRDLKEMMEFLQTAAAEQEEEDDETE